MGSKITDACFRFSTIFIVASLMYYPFNNKRLSNKFIGLWFFTAVSFFLHNVTVIYFTALSSFSDLSHQYSCFVSTVYLLGTVLFYFQLVRKRCELFVAMHRSEVILQGLDSAHNQHPTRGRLFALFKILMLMFCVVSKFLIFHVYDYGYIMKSWEAGLSLKTMVLATSRIFSENFNLSYSTFMYIAIFRLLIESEATECVYGLYFENRKVVWNQSIAHSVLFQSSCVQFDISNLVFNTSWILKKSFAKHSGRLVAKVSVWKKLLEIFLEIKNVRHSVEEICLKQYSFQACLVVLAFPVTVVYNSATVKLDKETCVAQVLVNALLLLPILLNTLIMYRTNYSANKMKREIFDYDDLKARQILGRFIHLSKDPYPQSHNSLFDIDFELLSKQIDFVVLISTTLFVH